jgi:hypothetical protein
MALPHFVFFEESWNHNNEPTTDEDYLEDGVYDFVSLPKKSKVVED